MQTMGTEKRNIYDRLESEKSWFLLMVVAYFSPFIISTRTLLYNYSLKESGNFC